MCPPHFQIMFWRHWTQNARIKLRHKFTSITRWCTLCGRQTGYVNYLHNQTWYKICITYKFTYCASVILYRHVKQHTGLKKLANNDVHHTAMMPPMLLYVCLSLLQQHKMRKNTYSKTVTITFAHIITYTETDLSKDNLCKPVHNHTLDFCRTEKKDA